MMEDCRHCAVDGVCVRELQCNGPSHDRKGLEASQFRFRGNESACPEVLT